MWYYRFAAHRPPGRSDNDIMQSSRAAAGQTTLSPARLFRPLPSPSGGTGFFRILWGEELAADTEGRGAGSIVCKTIVHLGGDFTLEGGGILRRFTGLLSQLKGEGFPERVSRFLAGSTPFCDQRE
jgi:hypothetical protein